MAAIKPSFGNENLNGPLSVGLVWAGLFNRGSGDFVTNVSGASNNATVQTAPMSGNLWTTPAAPDLTALDFVGDISKRLELATNPVPTLGGGYTVVARIIPDVDTGVFVFSNNDDTFTNLQDSLTIGAPFAPGTVSVRSRDGVGSALFVSATSTSTITIGSPVTIGATFETGSSRSVWVNGVKEATNTSVLTTPSTNLVTIGGAGDLTPSNPFNGQIVFFYIYSRVLSDAEMLSIHNDPYQMMVVGPSSPAPRNWNNHGWHRSFTQA